MLRVFPFIEIVIPIGVKSGPLIVSFRNIFLATALIPGDDPILITIIKSFLPLFIATVFLTMGSGLMSSLLSINMRLQGYGDQVIGLVMSGEDTEIDRNMVEEIYEPMVHMIRNSIDHGIEMPAERESAGKPRKGTINLKAYHKGGNIVIEIEDDGRGLNREKIREKAISSGLIKEDDTISDQEVDNLISYPRLKNRDEKSDYRLLDRLCLRLL